MRKITFILLLILTLISIASCAKDVEINSDVEMLLGEEFNIVKESSSEDDLDDASKTLNTEIRFEGGNFEVEVIRFVNLNKTVDDDYYSCQFIEFATAEQAENYYDLYLQSRLDGNDYKLRLFENIVVLTNSEEAMEIISGKFE